MERARVAGVVERLDLFRLGLPATGVEVRAGNVTLPGLIERTAEAGLGLLIVDVADPARGEPVPKNRDRGADPVQLTGLLKEEGSLQGSGQTCGGLLFGLPSY
jgi:hypothetical protein